MVNCKECNYDGYGIDMVVFKGDYLCPACATDKFVYMIEKKRKISKKNKLLKDYFNEQLYDCWNWVGKVTKALDIPEESSVGRVLDRIAELKNKNH